ncbi:MAG: M23 family metallopeptidase [Acidimicrobiia bacterium]
MAVAGSVIWAGATDKPALAAPQFPTGYQYPTETTTISSGGHWLAQGPGCPNPSGYLANEYHLGADLAQSSGGVYAVGSGQVVGVNPNWDGVGNYAVAILHTNGDGSQFVALYGHVQSPIANGATVTKGQQIATIGSLAHLHFGIRPGNTVNWTGNLSCSNWPNTVGFADPIAYLNSHTPSLPGEGSFVRASGLDVYRIAGGAVLKQYDCSVLGGCPGIIQITDAQLAAYPRTPSDGTFLRKAENQQIARIVAGSPVTIFDCGPLGGCPGVVNVNSLSVDDLVRAQPYPRNGAFLRRVETQVVLRMVGGTPVRLYNCGPLGGCPGIVDVNSSSVDELLNARPVPTNGTFIRRVETQVVLRIVGGSPVRLYNCGPLGGCPEIIDLNSSSVDDLVNVRPLPADGTFVRRVETAVVLRIAGGSPVQLFNCGPLGGCQGIVDVNSSSVDDLVNARPCPADGTVLQGLPSGQHWRISQCSRTRVGAQPAVQVDDLAVNAFACGTGAAQAQLANPSLDAASAIAVAQVAAVPIVRRRLHQRSSRRHPARENDHKGRGLWMRRLRAALLGVATLGAFLVITGAQGCGPPPGC